MSLAIPDDSRANGKHGQMHSPRFIPAAQTQLSPILRDSKINALFLQYSRVLWLGVGVLDYMGIFSPNNCCRINYAG